MNISVTGVSGGYGKLALQMRVEQAPADIKLFAQGRLKFQMAFADPFTKTAVKPTALLPSQTNIHRRQDGLH